MKPKNESGHYFAQYVLEHGPKGTDPNIWTASVTEYLQRHGITQTTPSTTLANVDWPEIRRIHNRLLGEGKQRRTADSTPAPSEPLKVKED